MFLNVKHKSDEWAKRRAVLAKHGNGESRTPESASADDENSKGRFDPEGPFKKVAFRSGVVPFDDSTTRSLST